MSVKIQITVTVPEIVINSATVRNAIVNKMQRKTAPDLKRMFGLTVNGWQDKPAFLQKFTNRTDFVSTQVWPGQNTKGGKTYRIVNEGSPAHRIRPRRAKLLRFQPGYRAGTRPRVLNSTSYSRFGNIVSARGVNHPGFEARDFDEEIAEQYGPTFAQDMQDAIHVGTVRQP